MSIFIDPADFEALKKDDALPSPSGVRLSIMRMCREEDVSLPELVTQIQADPALSGRIIKIGNGAGINKGRPVVAVSKDVLLMIGLHAVRQLTLAISLTTDRRDAACVGFDHHAFWARTVAMACAAQALAEYYGGAPPGEMFATGLLANIGRLGLASARAAQYSTLLTAGYRGDQLLDAESGEFGYTHLDLAAAMMSDWDIPTMFCEAVLHHEAPAAARLDDESRVLQLAQILHVAGAIADYCVALPDLRVRALQDIIGAGAPVYGEIDHVMALCDRIGRDWVEWSAMVYITVEPLPVTREVAQSLPGSAPA